MVVDDDFEETYPTAATAIGAENERMYNLAVAVGVPVAAANPQVPTAAAIPIAPATMVAGDQCSVSINH